MKPLIKLTDVNRHYPSGDSQTCVLKDISLEIFSGEMVAIMGPSGSGKSTLMNILGGLDRPSGGTYKLAGIDVAELNDDQLARLRREFFGFVFQRYQLIASMTAAQNVEVPAVYAGCEQKRRQARAGELLTLLGLGDRKNYYPAQLSGGQQQRVSIARALMNGGQIILADEPTGALDSEAGHNIMALLRQLCTDGHTVILVTHDADIARQADRVIALRDGKCVDSPSAIRDVARNKIGDNAPAFPGDACLLAWFITSVYDAFLMAWRIMRDRKVRTFLTMLGIIIGIASVVTLVMVGDAAQEQVLKNLHSMGTDTIAVYPGRDIGDESYLRSLTYEDISLIKRQPWVHSVSASVSSSERIRYGSRDFQANINGVSSEYFTLYGMHFSEGHAFSDAQLDGRAQVVVLDKNTRRRMFPGETRVEGNVILIGKVPFIVTGVTEDGSGSVGSSMHIWTPWTTMASRMTGTGWLESITVRAREGAGTGTEKKLTNLLALYHGRKDFYIRNSDAIRKSVEKTTGTFRLFLTLIAGISLIVGGIGVMNIMLVSVTERTREIGIRMAVGARARDVLLQFLIEAVLVCLVGGIAGLILSGVAAQVLKFYLPGWNISLSVSSMLTAFSCAMVTGVLSGWLPARIAANQKPVTSLARE